MKEVNLKFSLSPWLVSLNTISIPGNNIRRHLEKPQHLGGFSTQMVSPLSGLPTVILSSRSVGLCMRFPARLNREYFHLRTIKQMVALFYPRDEPLNTISELDTQHSIIGQGGLYFSRKNVLRVFTT